MWTAARTELISTYVLPEHRGRNIGGRLVEAFFAWSRERHHRALGWRMAEQRDRVWVARPGRATASRVTR